jgi:hypothetical protein
MDSIERYQEILENLLREYAYRPSHGDIRPEVIVDAGRRHFELMQVGWDGSRRVHGSVLHIDIIDDKIWIQYDGTPDGVAQELVDAGIPHDKIVLGFRPERVRQFSGYAIH